MTLAAFVLIRGPFPEPCGILSFLTLFGLVVWLIATRRGDNGR